MIVAIGHTKNVGKDTFIKFCLDILRVKTRNVKIIRRGFADKLYELCFSLYGWAGFKSKVYYDDNFHRKNDMLSTNKTVRQTLIDVGMKLREFDSDIWINAALRTMDADITFISDLRFPNEFLHCLANDAILLRLTRPYLPEPTDEADTALNGWESRWSLHVENTGDLNVLYEKALEFCDKYLSKFYRS